MAIFHLHAKIFKRSKGHRATAAAAYRSGDRIKCDRTGKTHDYTRKSGVIRSEIFAPSGSPKWVFDRSTLWNRVEQIEKRKDAQVGREVEVSLPSELSRDQQFDLVRDFVRENFTNSGMVADVSFHDTGRGNPHAHIMLTMRDLEDDGFGLKNRGWNDRGLVEKWRASWADHSNLALSKWGHDSQIDHRSYERQGSRKKATKHHGNRETLRAKLIRQYNKAVADFNRQIDEIEVLKYEIENQTPEPEPVIDLEPVISPKITSVMDEMKSNLEEVRMAAEQSNLIDDPGIFDLDRMRNQAKKWIDRFMGRPGNSSQSESREREL